MLSSWDENTKTPRTDRLFQEQQSTQVTEHSHQENIVRPESQREMTTNLKKRLGRGSGAAHSSSEDVTHLSR